MPTLLELAGADAPAELEGRSLLTLLQGHRALPDRPIYAEKTYHDSYDPMRAVRTPTRKYIKNFVAGPKLSLAMDLEASLTRQGMGDDHLAPRPEEELYLLDTDPDELHNVADEASHVDDLQRLRELTLEWMRRTGDPLLDGDIAPMPRPTRPTRERH